MFQHPPVVLIPAVQTDRRSSCNWLDFAGSLATQRSWC